MTNSERLKICWDSGRTVFRLGDLSALWKINPLNTKMSARRMVETRVLLNPARGYYAVKQDYDVGELANLILAPSYVSFNTALFRAGVNFQQRDTVDSVATLGYSRSIEGKVFSYYAMKDALFYNLEGVSVRGGVSLATPERAILDSFYFGFMPDIDIPDKIDQAYLKKLSILYPLTVQKKAGKLYGTKV